METGSSVIVFVKTDTRTVFSRNHAAPEIFIYMKMFSLHDQVHALYEKLPANNYVMAMDNLYMSAKICR